MQSGNKTGGAEACARWLTRCVPCLPRCPRPHMPPAPGVEAAGETAFVLVAGGLGERLGYSGIKVALPMDLASGACFLQRYVESILALQRAAQAAHPGRRLPLAIMTSDDTHARTLELLESHAYFGAHRDQIHLLKQEKVACLADNDARLALDPKDPGAVQTKPHGHGDVHMLLHSSGLAEAWAAEGLQWVAFFQDTNGLVFRALPAALGADGWAAATGPGYLLALWGLHQDRFLLRWAQSTPGAALIDPANLPAPFCSSRRERRQQLRRQLARGAPQGQGGHRRNHQTRPRRRQQHDHQRGVQSGGRKGAGGAAADSCSLISACLLVRSSHQMRRLAGCLAQLSSHSAQDIPTPA